MTLRIENGVTYEQDFDAENHLVFLTVNGQTTDLIYDGDGCLTVKFNPDNTSTIYIGSGYEVHRNSWGGPAGTTTYYPAAGAMRVNGSLYYVLKDKLGSASVVLNDSGGIVGETRYYPFGETRETSGSLLTDRLFTGQREITGLGGDEVLLARDEAPCGEELASAESGSILLQFRRQVELKGCFSFSG